MINPSKKLIKIKFLVPKI